jgi:hypothetical protein
MVVLVTVSMVVLVTMTMLITMTMSMVVVVSMIVVSHDDDRGHATWSRQSRLTVQVTALHVNEG